MLRLLRCGGLGGGLGHPPEEVQEGGEDLHAMQRVAVHGNAHGGVRQHHNAGESAKADERHRGQGAAALERHLVHEALAQSSPEA
jgi:hypothetical protein